MLTRALALKRAKKFLAECKKLSIHIDKAYLFGSAAVGKNTKYSDIDVALFSSQFTENILNNLDLIAKVNIHFPDIDAHTFNSKEYKHSTGVFIEEIKKTGIEI